jgi:biopolymer transport protein ExbD
MGLKKRTHVSPEFNLASMIDVIFLLLMFFMLTSKLVSTNALNVSLPSSSQKEGLPVKAINVSLEADGRLFYESDETPLDKPSLLAAMTARVGELIEQGTKREEITVVLNADKNTTTQQLVDVMTITRKLGLQMSLSTEEVAEEQ